MHEVYGTSELFSQTSCTLYKHPTISWLGLNCTNPRVSCVNCRSECYHLGSWTSPSCHTRVVAMSQLQEVKEKTLIPAWPGKPARGGRRYHLLPWEALLPKHTGDEEEQVAPSAWLPQRKHPRTCQQAFQWSSLPTTSRNHIRSLPWFLLTSTSEKQIIFFFFLQLSMCRCKCLKR